MLARLAPRDSRLTLLWQHYVPCLTISPSIVIEIFPISAFLETAAELQALALYFPTIFQNRGKVFGMLAFGM